MRSKPVWALVAFTFAALAVWMSFGSPIASQDSLEHTHAPADSVELGHVFDFDGQQAFLSQLGIEERARLIKLYSRFALADAACPLPQSASDVFYVKFHQPLDAAFAGRLRDAGAAFVGYANPNTHFIRARDADSLAAIGDLLTSSDNVAGTLHREYADKFCPDAWQMWREGMGGEFMISFWRDVSPDAAAALLSFANAEILQAMTDYDGKPDLIDGALQVTVTAAGLDLLATSPLIEFIEPRPVLAVFNAGSTALSNASPAQIGPGTPYNLTGRDLVVAVFDDGRARPTHVGFSGAATVNPLGTVSTRVLAMQNLSTGSHATHVTGTIVGNGTGSTGGRGYAPEAYALNYTFQSSIFVPRRDARSSHLIVADNHSYGQTSGTMGAYNSTSQNHDIDCRDILLLMCTSAGNSGPNDTTLRGDKGMKNALVIASTTNTGGISSFSSRGPSIDGRLQPQFSAKGSSVSSTWSTSDTAYNSISGTSMSGPGVAGAVTLLAELWQREHSGQFFAPDVARGVVALTAQDAYNPGPDYRFGYGIVDVQAAADVILADKNGPGRRIVRGHARQGSVDEYEFEVMSSATPLAVTLSWLDIWASTSASVVLVNDLDLELVSPSNVVHFPYSGLTSLGSQTHQWTTTGPNRRDNLELTRVDSPETGIWTVRVRGFSMPSNPQAGVLNDVVGYVLSSTHDIERPFVRVDDPLNTGSPVSIPDNNPAGITRTFNVSSFGLVEGVRVYCHITHAFRGDLKIELRHPDSTTVVLNDTGTSPRKDLVAVYPDTRQYADDVTALIGKPAGGIWQVIISDNGPQDLGEVRHLSLEIDLDLSNLPPAANAGPNQIVDSGTLVQLDGSASSDPENDPLTFAWVQTAGPFAQLTGADTATPGFIAPVVPSTIDCIFQLTVDDGKGGQDSDTVTVTVEPPNIPPVADAGADFLIVSGQQGNLNGSASSDPNGDPLTYLWTEVSTSLLNLSQSDVANPTFIAPSVGSITQITMQLTVDDGRGGQDSDTVTVTIEPPNTPPVANAGLNRTVTREASVVLNASGSSDADNDPLTFLWSQTAGNNTVVLNGANAAVATFTAPAEDDILVFMVLVDDGRGGQDSHTVTITVSGAASSGSGGSSGGDAGGCSTPDSSGALWILLIAACLGWLSRRRARRKFD